MRPTTGMGDKGRVPSLIWWYTALLFKCCIDNIRNQHFSLAENTQKRVKEVAMVLKDGEKNALPYMWGNDISCYCTCYAGLGAKWNRHVPRVPKWLCWGDTFSGCRGYLGLQKMWVQRRRTQVYYWIMKWPVVWSSPELTNCWYYSAVALLCWLAR